MKHTDLTKRLARDSGVSQAHAADQLEKVVHQIVINLRKGQPVDLPGLGRFTPGQKWRFEFDENSPTPSPKDK